MDQQNSAHILNSSEIRRKFTTNEEFYLLSEKHFADLYTREDQRQMIRNLIADTNDQNLFAGRILTACAVYAGKAAWSWLLGPGETTPYLFFDVLDQLQDAHLKKQLALGTLLSENPAIPYDFRALMAERLVADVQNELITLTEDEENELKQVVQEEQPVRLRTIKETLRLPTDGNEHLFEVPRLLEDRLNLINEVSKILVNRARGVLVSRVLNAIFGMPSHSNYTSEAFRSAQVEKLIGDDVQCGLIDPTDYLVHWNEVFRFRHNSTLLSLAEIFKIVLYSDELHLPDVRIRQSQIDFYRAALKISGRAQIGLRAGVFYVDHGVMAYSSYFYMGRDAALGKGCMIDGIGGAVLLRGSYLGGGLMPVLIRTHKHIKVSEASFAPEQKRIKPCVFVARSGGRLPTTAQGTIEAADYLSSPSPFEGIGALPITSAPAHFRLCL